MLKFVYNEKNYNKLLPLLDKENKYFEDYIIPNWDKILKEMKNDSYLIITVVNKFTRETTNISEYTIYKQNSKYRLNREFYQLLHKFCYSN